MVEDLGGGNETSKGLADIFISNFSPNGDHRWQRVLGGTLNDAARNVAIDDDGNTTLTGAFSDTVNFGDGDVTSKGGQDIFLVKFGW